MTTNNTTNTKPILSFDYMDNLLSIEEYYRNQPEYDTYNRHQIEEMAIQEANANLDDVKEELDKWIEQRGKDYEYFFGLDGSITQWSGSVDFFNIYEIHDIGQLLSRFQDTTNIKVDIYDDKVEIINTHHDGNNLYVLYPLNTIDKDTIAYIVLKALSGPNIETARKDYDEDLSKISYEQMANLLKEYNLTQQL